MQLLRYTDHSSIATIKGKPRNVTSFDFVEVSEADIKKGILSLDKNKASQNFTISNKAIKKKMGHF